jgi:inorganic pyrophosphatase
MRDLYKIPMGENAPNIVNVIVETPKGSSNKYEYNRKLDMFELDRALYSPMHYPGDYGFIPNTLADDGDPLDILILINQPTAIGTLVRAKPLGILEMTDDKGRDQKILATAIDDPRYGNRKDLNDLAAHRLDEIEHFFKVYKDLEKKQVTVEGWLGIEEAHRVILETAAAFK